MLEFDSFSEFLGFVLMMIGVFFPGVASFGLVFQKLDRGREHPIPQPVCVEALASRRAFDNDDLSVLFWKQSSCRLLA